MQGSNTLTYPSFCSLLRRANARYLFQALLLGLLLVGSAMPSAQAQGIPNAAAFVKTDATTKGSWQGVYGKDGYNIIQNSANYPSYAAVTPSGQTAFTWNPPYNASALQKAPPATDNIAACWYAASTFSMDVNLTDGLTHQVALYCLDWLNSGRVERIDIKDFNNPNTTLNTQTLGSFSTGTYLVWNIQGHVVINITTLASPNAVVSGLFFDHTAAASSAAAFLKTDTTTQGNWKDVYGKDGYNVIQDSASYPAYAAVTPSGQTPFTWLNPANGNVGALQKATSTTDSIAACWYTTTNSFSIDVNLTDGLAHQVALYALDWGNIGRAERIDIYVKLNLGRSCTEYLR